MKRNTIIAILMVLFTTSLLFITPEVLSDTKKYILNGKEYGIVKGSFRGKWWNYFERGHSFAEGKFWTEAEADLKKAIKKRSKDNRRARTYGLHFVEYFPHRELGIVYFNQGKYKEAESEIIMSLSQEESAKAKFYLNKARKVIIKRNKSDRSAPVISISTPCERKIVPNLDITVRGTSTDNQYVSEVEVNGNPVFIETANKIINFSQKVRLKPGNNTIVVTAADLAENVAYKKITVTVDRQAPLLSIESIERHTKNSFKINGVVTDQTKIAKLNIGGDSIPITDMKKIEFSQTVRGLEGSVISFKVADSTGNITDGIIVLESLKLAQPDNKRAVSERQVTPVRFASLTDSTLIDIIASVESKHSFSKTTGTDDVTSPFIKLKKRIRDKQEVFFDSFFIEGKVKDTGGVVSLTINDEPILFHSGVMLHFNFLSELENGLNEFVIVATDAAGNSSKKAIIVERKIPASRQVSSRLSTAILPFQLKGEKDTFASIIPDSFLDAINNKNRFNVVARNEDLESILIEHKLNMTDLVDKSKAIRVGKIVSAEIIIGGSVMETSKFLQIYARVIDTETSEVMVTTDVYGEEVDMEVFEYLIGGLTWKIMRSFPMIEGTVVKNDNQSVCLDVGEEQSVKKNMRFLIYRLVDVTTDTESPDGIIEMLREVKVSSVDRNISKSKIVHQFDDKPVRVSDFAITK